jgi:cytochrome b subunit of formate dehydrogenase
MGAWNPETPRTRHSRAGSAKEERVMRTIRGKILAWFVSAVLVLCGALGVVLYQQVNAYPFSYRDVKNSLVLYSTSR